MADLPYTDGSNGNGITDASELWLFLKKYPLALMDQRYMIGYMPLIKSDESVLHNVRTMVVALINQGMMCFVNGYLPLLMSEDKVP